MCLPMFDESWPSDLLITQVFLVLGRENRPLLHSGWASGQSQSLMKKVIERSSLLIQANLSPHTCHAEVHSNFSLV